LTDIAWWRVIAMMTLAGSFCEIGLVQTWRKGDLTARACLRWGPVIGAIFGVLVLWPPNPGRPPSPVAWVATMGALGAVMGLYTTWRSMRWEGIIDRHRQREAARARANKQRTALSGREREHG
jgi:predicted small integral membrane protein